MVKKALLIVNPHSGKRKGVRDAALIRERLAARGIGSSFFVSEGEEQLEQFIEKCSPAEYDLVGIVGGDGTMHSFLNAALKRFDTVPWPVALFPCGTGNAFNYDIGCTSIDETLNCIFADKQASIDIAEIRCDKERIWSFNIAGCGLVAEINRLAEKLRWLGASRYTIASLLKLLVNPRTHLKISTEHGSLEGRFSFVLACNTRYTGKGMLMAPHAKLSDGKFDVIIVKACSAFTLLRLFPKIFKGSHVGADVVRYDQTAMLTVEGSNALPTNIDGELKGQAPFSLAVRCGKVKVFTK